MGRATRHETGRPVQPRRAAGAFTLIELLVVITIIGVLAAMAAPKFSKAVAQVQANIAITNLKAVWAAERYYWINSSPHAYADLPTLQSQNLVDSTLNNGNGPYVYSVDLTNGFTVYAKLGDGTGFMISVQNSQVTTLTGQAVSLPY
jgi:prepilin-type N-terminal cleavage/methylation domain-containing protein